MVFEKSALELLRALDHAIKYTSLIERKWREYPCFLSRVVDTMPSAMRWSAKKKKIFRFLIVLLPLVGGALLLLQIHDVGSDNAPLSHEVGRSELNRSTTLADYLIKGVRSLRFSRRLKEFRSVANTYPRDIPLDLIEQYYDAVGPPAMLDVLEEEPSYCHAKAHNVGRVIYKRTQNLAAAMEIARNRCGTGAFHGILMELFGTDSDVFEASKLKDQATSVCDRPEVRSRVEQGVCLHGVGHAFMYLADYDTGTGLSFCDFFDERGTRYYCATGLFMERDQVYGPDDLDISRYYPCDRYDYPAACYRYKMIRAFRPAGYEAAARSCETLPDPAQRSGCFHGVGFGFFTILEDDPGKLSDLCRTGSLLNQELCIEGAVGILSAVNGAQAEKVCEMVSPETQSLCDRARTIGNFGMNRDFDLYYVRQGEL